MSNHTGHTDDLTKVRLIGAAFKSNSFLRALYQEMSHQLIGHVSYCRDTESTFQYIYKGMKVNMQLEVNILVQKYM